MKFLAGLLAAMSVLFAVALLAYSEVIDLPGAWREELGFAEAAPDPPCHLGLYRRAPGSPAPAPGHWRLGPEAPRGQVEGSATALGRDVYLLGGGKPGNLHRVVRYDTRSGEWSEPAQLPVGLNHSPATAHNGRIYLAGGYLEGEAATARGFEFDPRADRWSEIPPMKRARGGAAAAAIGGKLYVVDGGPQFFDLDDPPPPFALLEIFDFRTRTWSTGTPPPIAVHHVAAAALGGKLYMAGGRVDTERATANFLSYDPATERWTRLPDLPQGAIGSAGVVAAGGRIVVFGGDDEVGWEDGGGWVSAAAWAYDPATQQWTRLPDLHVERHAFGAAVAGNRIYAIAGSYCPGLKPTGPVATHTVESLPVSAVRES
jgi:N-acetylneuraminic acid mutarotase